MRPYCCVDVRVPCTPCGDRIITSDEEIFGQKRVTRQAADAVSEAKEATDGAEADADAGADDGADAGAEDSAEAGEAAEAAAEL